MGSHPPKFPTPSPRLLPSFLCGPHLASQKPPAPARLSSVLGLLQPCRPIANASPTAWLSCHRLQPALSLSLLQSVLQVAAVISLEHPSDYGTLLPTKLRYLLVCLRERHRPGLSQTALTDHLSPLLPAVAAPCPLLLHPRWPGTKPSASNPHRHICCC